MINIKKPKITYKITDDSIILSNVLLSDKGERDVVVMRQLNANDLDSIQLWQSSNKLTAKDIDDKTLSILITQWGDRTSIASIEIAKIPLETRRLLLEMFQQFCTPVYELVESVSPEGEA